MALGLTATSALTSLTAAALDWYVRGDAFAQTIQDKPLLRALRGRQKSFPGGKGNISIPVQGKYMSDTQGPVGIIDDDALTFIQPDNLLRASYPWKQIWYGFMVSETQLLVDGISVNDPGSKRSEHSKIDLSRLTPWLKNQMDDFAESWARGFNAMLWNDGSQDAKAVPGLRYLLPDDPTTGSCGGLSRATYTWWRHRALVGANKIVSSPSAQTLTKTLRREHRQLTRYGGNPNFALAGSGFLDAIEAEIHEKGSYTLEGFLKENATQLSMWNVHMKGVGKFEYDPTMDDIGWSKRCVLLDLKHLSLQPIEGEDNKVRKPERPYNYLVFAQGMTWAGALTANQLNCHGVYEVA